ncbi:phospholipase C, phosphocholine-specific [Sphaerisporangium melleum]|uniref:phospholipase C n=1 Tax=Sphaerisporangium melleum TaxID=321316 RepID=A0A917RFZ5_9ACTN|nr:phospholipase C, phosphocholine-specific [Sphaerisporangium melleum]GGL04636.1 phospholipase C, phosphocholine-specific [Sphaerisporangium melleum]GII74099.1 phospholipase C, phosphocholine-specific [Sphaerisporangium melleum]
MSQGLSRRGFLAAGAGAAAVSVLPPSVHAAMAMPAPSGGLSAIKHVVFLMQENRSFDHYFGRLRGVRGFGDRNAVTLPDGRPVFEQPDGAGRVLPFPVREAAGIVGKDLQWISALPHGWGDGQQAAADGWHNGWVAAKSPATMAYYERRDLPLQYELADSFTICDHYFCSVLSSTSPNRNYHVSGHTGYEPGTTKRAIDNSAYDEDTHAGYTWANAGEVLEAAGHSWKVYQEWDNYEDNNLEFFAAFRRIARKALRGDFQSMDSFYSALGRAATDADREAMLARLEEGVAALTPQERSLYERALRRGRPGTLAAGFRADVEAGRLPKVSYIVPPAADSEHPSASSPIQSAQITWDILDAIASTPEVWRSTALFITYDENDGFFDHVPPPRPPAERTDEFYDGKPIGLGVRVPMVVVSPWTIGGYACSQVFDHSSTVRFLESWLKVRFPDISAWRRTVSGDLTSAFDFTRAGSRPTPAHPAPVPPFTGRWRPAPPADQRMPVQEKGVRRARPLPYQPEASARLHGAELRLTLANRGTESAHMAVYPYAGELPAPLHADVLGETTRVVPVPGDRYELVLTGPNGFRREFSGSRAGAAAGVQVSAQVDGEALRLTLLLVNEGTERVRLRVRALAYDERDLAVVLRPGESRRVPWPAKEAQGWYDARITCEQDASFGRRLMGHIENGRPSITG